MAGKPEVLDVGVGMRPDMTGQGLGCRFVAAVLEFAAQKFAPRILRATIAGFNRRSARVFESLGFERMCRFERLADGLEFWQLEKRIG